MMTARRIVSAILLMSLFAPAVRADLVADPNEFRQLKKLTGFDKRNNSNGSGYIAPSVKDTKKQAVVKTSEKVVKVDAKASVKGNAKTEETVSVEKSDRSKTRALTTDASKKSN
jgi:hypothetical protein